MPLIKKKKMNMEMPDAAEPKSLAIAYNMKSKAKKMASGGMARMEDDQDEKHPSSVAEAIMNKKSGQADLEANEMEGGVDQDYDELNELAAHEPAFDVDQLSEQPGDSIGSDIEEDAHDMIGKIRSKIRKRGA